MNHDCIYKMNHKGRQAWKLNCCQILNSCQPQKGKDGCGDSQTSSSIKFALNIKWLQTVSRRSTWCDLVREKHCFGSVWKGEIWHIRTLRPLIEKPRQRLDFPWQAITSWKHGPEEALMAHGFTFLGLLLISVVLHWALWSCPHHLPPQ